MRPYIHIDDEPTVELDYSGMSVRMIYHQRGIDYHDDPYAIPEIEAYAVAQGRKPKFYREAIKKLVQAMLNNEGEDSHPEMVKLDETFVPKFKRAEVRDMILREHAEIADAFGAGIGKVCQRQDSDIALQIIVSMMDEGILCLPIHDGFVCKASHRRKLQEMMVNSYLERFGYAPIIKDCKGIY